MIRALHRPQRPCPYRTAATAARRRGREGNGVSCNIFRRGDETPADRRLGRAGVEEIAQDGAKDLGGITVGIDHPSNAQTIDQCKTGDRVVTIAAPGMQQPRGAQGGEALGDVGDLLVVALAPRHSR